MSKLLPCPFCGGDAEMVTAKGIHGGYLFGIICNICASRGDLHDTETQAIDAWNSRVPVEYDGWFYLPKPKDGIVDYGETEITRTENGYKIEQPVELIDSTIRSWGDELGDYVMKRICEVWNTRADDYHQAAEYWQRLYEETFVKRTCKDLSDSNYFRCSVCKKKTYRGEETFNYCPNCGAMVVSE